MSATFRAMSTDVTVIAPTLDDDDELAATRRVAEVFADAEQRFSRFREDSELSRLNRSRAPFVASPALFAALLRARAHVRSSGGIFDPAIGAALCRAGYDRSFASHRLDRDAPPVPPVRPARFDEVALDEPTRTVTLPIDLRLDLGGFVKGLTVDLAASSFAGPIAIDAGGDAVLRGEGPTGDGWEVDVEDPRDASRTLLTLRVRDRAVATSSPNRRRWRTGPVEQHHLIDPRTFEPARSDLVQVTVIARCAEQADVLAKVAFVLGADAGTRWLEGRPAVGAVLVGREGDVWRVGQTEVANDG
ncbi:MAG: FAD:protein FMN transferase [Deltaproteobacteria bacterium]|nr:FAD:protein FMN transferase [Deltaproteobacteria bacterium]